MASVQHCRSEFSPSVFLCCRLCSSMRDSVGGVAGTTRRRVAATKRTGSSIFHFRRLPCNGLCKIVSGTSGTRSRRTIRQLTAYFRVFLGSRWAWALQWVQLWEFWASWCRIAWPNTACCDRRMPPVCTLVSAPFHRRTLNFGVDGLVGWRRLVAIHPMGISKHLPVTLQ